MASLEFQANPLITTTCLDMSKVEKRELIMKVIYLQTHSSLYLSGEIVPLKDLPDDVLFHYVGSEDRAPDFNYINYYRNGELWDHADSSCFDNEIYSMFKGKGRKIGNNEDWRNVWGYII